MTTGQIIDKLREDEHYYGEFGSKFLSNSDIKTLLKNPLGLREPSKTTVPFLVGGYFHTAILEPDKIKNFKVVQASTRNTKAYKEISNGELCLLEHEVDMIENMVDKVMSNNVCRDLIHGDNIDHEEPNITELCGLQWKGKSDVVNHNEKLIIDLKTTNDLDGFRWNSKKYNYDSQAYIYKELFGYEFVFIAIDKNDGRIGLFDCSSDFYLSGKNKVEKACEAYDLFYNTEEFDPQQYFINQTL